MPEQNIKVPFKDTGIPFHIEAPMFCFEKADADGGRTRRIGGIISTESPDKQGDVLIQKGLDFTDFLGNFGWINDNHSKATTDILGYPESVDQFEKGDVLPNGQTAPANCTWMEGYLLDTPKASEIWELGQALQKAGRSLGYSVEGSILKRTGPLRKHVAKAKVREVAVTKCPVNVDSGMQCLIKSLEAVENGVEPELVEQLIRSNDVVEALGRIEAALEKALSMGAPPAGNANPSSQGSTTGEGAGQIITGQSLDKDKKKKRKDEIEDEYEKSLTRSEAIAWAMDRIPNCTTAQAERFVRITKELKSLGRL